jgi:DNA-binding GntR family transcriptional regulator
MQLIKRDSLRTKLADHLFEAIVRGELRPGQRIIENKLARQLDVGQSSLREALQDLEHRGLLTKMGNRGTFVTRLSGRDVENICAVRAELEPMAAALAARNLNSAAVLKLRGYIDEMENARSRRDLVALLRNDFEFHQHIWQLSGNPSLARALTVVCAPLFVFYLLVRPETIGPADISDEQSLFSRANKAHYTLLDALIGGNPDGVRKIFREMVEECRLIHLRALQQHEAEVSESAAVR